MLDSSSPPPTTATDPNRTAKIVGLVALGCVALCGVLGTCVLGIILLAPIFTSSSFGP